MPEKVQWGLFDGSFYRFGDRSISLSNQRQGEQPQLVTWVPDVELPITFYTDMRLSEVGNGEFVKVALLLEPPSISDTHYKTVASLMTEFDYILSFNRDFFGGMPNFLYYPLGGSWIPADDWGVKEKTRNFSMFTTDKKKAPGHKVRRHIAKMASDLGVDIYGRGSDHPVVSKVEGLAPYRYSIVVESCAVDGYFSEKLIDCFSQGTIPIYWGSRDTAKYFDENGIIYFQTFADLTYLLLNVCSPKDYIARQSSILTNYRFAREYQCAEDNIYWRHLDKFKYLAARKYGHNPTYAE